MAKNLSDMHAQVIEYLKQGKFAEGIEEFYAEDAFCDIGRSRKAFIGKDYAPAVPPTGDQWVWFPV